MSDDIVFLEVPAHSVKVKEQVALVRAKQPCPHCGVEVIHIQSHIKRKHLEQYKKGKDGVKRKRKIRTTCFECELSMDEVSLDLIDHLLLALKLFSCPEQL